MNKQQKAKTNLFIQTNIQYFHGYPIKVKEKCVKVYTSEVKIKLKSK